MKIVVDTNVFVSGAFFRGPPHEILSACATSDLQLVLSPIILEEYRRVGSEFLQTRLDMDYERFMGTLLESAMMINVCGLEHQVCRDADDDKFLACAIAGGAAVVVSGDKALLETSGFGGVAVLTPRQFVERYLRSNR